MKAATLNLEIERYATFLVDLQVKKPGAEPDTTVPDNITGCTPRMQVRASAESNEVLLELNTTNGRIVVMDAPSGKLRLLIDSNVTTSLTWTSAVYDLVLAKSPQDTRRLLEGLITVSPGVTR